MMVFGPWRPVPGGIRLSASHATYDDGLTTMAGELGMTKRRSRAGSKPAPSFALASVIADGTDIDWVRAEREAAGPDERGVIEQLRVIALLAGVHRNPGPRPEAAGSTPITSRNVTTIEHRHAASELGRWGDLDLIEEIGEGAFGVVYRAQ